LIIKIITIIIKIKQAEKKRGKMEKRELGAENKKRRQAAKYGSNYIYIYLYIFVLKQTKVSYKIKDTIYLIENLICICNFLK